MYDAWKYTQIHQQELLRKAEQTRLANLALGRRKYRFNLILARLGRGLVVLGEALHRRYAPAKSPVAPFPIDQAIRPVVNSNMMTWNAGDSACERKPPDGSHRENSFLRITHTRRHSPSRKKSNG